MSLVVTTGTVSMYYTMYCIIIAVDAEHTLAGLTHSKILCDRNIITITIKFSSPTILPLEWNLGGRRKGVSKQARAILVLTY